LKLIESVSTYVTPVVYIGRAAWLRKTFPKVKVTLRSPTFWHELARFVIFYLFTYLLFARQAFIMTVTPRSW